MNERPKRMSQTQTMNSARQFHWRRIEEEEGGGGGEARIGISQVQSPTRQMKLCSFCSVSNEKRECRTNEETVIQRDRETERLTPKQMASIKIARAAHLKCFQVKKFKVFFHCFKARRSFLLISVWSRFEKLNQK